MRKTHLIALTTFALAGPAVSAEDVRPPLLCGGAEPFWSLEIEDDAAMFSSPDTPQIDYVIQDERSAVGRFWPKALTMLASADTAIAILRPMQCSDTMSDYEYGWTVDVLTQRRGEPVLLTGCCRPKPAAED